MILRNVVEWFDKQTGSFNWTGNPVTGAAYVEIVTGTPGGSGTSPTDLSTGTKQDAQTALLQALVTANAGGVDMETPSANFKVNTAFTNASVDDIIIGILTLNTATNVLVSTTPVWFNWTTGSIITVSTSDRGKLTLLQANALTASQLMTQVTPVSVASIPSHNVTNVGTFAVQATQALVPLTATLSSKTASASSQTLLAANSARKGVVIHNDSTAMLYVKYGATATTSIGGFTYELNPEDTLEINPIQNGIYTGVIDGIWSAANGGCSITELS